MKREVTPPFRPQLVHSQHPSHPTTPTTTTTTTNYHTPTLSKLKQTKGVEDVSNFDKKYTSVRPIDSPVNSNDAITLSQENMFLGFSYVCVNCFLILNTSNLTHPCPLPPPPTGKISESCQWMTINKAKPSLYFFFVFLQQIDFMVL